MSDERTYKVDLLTRVEGEGRFWLRVVDGEVVESKLQIFEAPRYFEALLRGRSLFDAPDVVARICGICPVAYQMSCVQALEAALALEPPAGTLALRRLLYCGEWIESHTLHVVLLHAPDFLGYESAMAMAAASDELRAIVERGLRMKKAGNALIELLGGRAIHPISVRVGGFTKVPRRAELRAIRGMLAEALEDAVETVAWAAALPMPAQRNEYVFVALRCADAYPLERGDAITISGRGEVPIEEFETHLVETQVPHSNAVQAHLVDGTPYLCGPMARLNLCHEQLHPRAAEALRRSGLALPVLNPYQSIIVRAVEIVHAFAEAIDLIDAYTPPDSPFSTPDTTAAATGFGATEAPRGVLFHRYDLQADGTIANAVIVPPTSQNQARIEQDLVALAPDLLALDHAVATARCEQLIRAYDPCISCATHFLTLDIER